MKKNIIAIILVFAMLTGFAACRKLENEGDWVIESKVYVVDEYGAQVDVQSVVKDNGETEYYYYDTNGNKVTVAQKDVVVETTKIYKAASTTISPELQSFLEAYTDPDSFQQLIEEDLTQPELSISDEPIPEGEFKETTVELGSDGKPVRKGNSYVDILSNDSFTADFIVRADYNGEQTAVPFYVTKNSDNMYIETTMPVETGSMRFEFLVKDKECYAIIPAMRAYVKIDSETMGEMIPEGANLEQEDNSVYVKSGKVTHDGVTYDCDIYDANGQTVKYYYQNDELKRVESYDGEDNVSIVEYNSVEKGADTSKFKIPSNYMDMTSVLGGSFDFTNL